MPWLTVAPYVVIVALLGWIGWLKYDAAKEEARIAVAVSDAKDKAQKASDEVIQQVTANLSKVQHVKETHTEKVISLPVTADDDACRRSQRQRVTTAGVRATVLGSGATPQQGTTDSVRSTILGTGPRQSPTR